MKIARLLCAIWMCSPPALQAGPAEPAPTETVPVERGPAERGPAERGPAEPAPAGSASHFASPPARGQIRKSAPVGSAKGAVSNNNAAPASPLHESVTAPRVAGQPARGNINPHSRLRTPAAPAPKPSNRPAGSSRAGSTATSVARTTGFHGASQATLPSPAAPAPPATAPAASKIAARVPASARPSAKAGNSLVGGPRQAGLGRIGGPAIGRAATANAGAIDGALMRRRLR
jgi:hypothetical protein